MNTKNIIAFVAVFAASSAFAADAPAAAAATAAVAANVATSAAAASLTVPTVTINQSSGLTRAQVHAEAVEFVKNHKTAFAVQLDQYKN